jgi:hypothetical protein
VIEAYLTLTFQQNLDADALLTVEVSGDLITWSTDPTLIEPVSSIDNRNGTATVTVRIAEPISTDLGRNFVRLRSN